MNLSHLGAVRPFVDTASIGVLLASIDGAMPSIAALFTAIWAFLRVWETVTVQKHLRRRRLTRRRLRRIRSVR